MPRKPFKTALATTTLLHKTHRAAEKFIDKHILDDLNLGIGTRVWHNTKFKVTWDIERAVEYYTPPKRTMKNARY